MVYEIHPFIIDGKEYYSLTHLGAILNLGVSTIYKVFRDYEKETQFRFANVSFNGKTTIGLTKDEFDKIVSIVRYSKDIYINKKRNTIFYKAFDLFNDKNSKKEILEKMQELWKIYKQDEPMFQA